MRVSIITPVYNGINYIEKCVSHVAGQNMPGLEHIIVDGLSTDGTREKLFELQSRHDHLRVISEKDKGQSDAMNKGLKAATADIIGILNVDDFYEPGAIEEAVAFLERNASIDMVVGDCNIIDADGRLSDVSRPSDLRLESLLLGWFFAHHPVNPSAYFYRKSVHDAVGEYHVSEHLAMDIQFIFDCAERVRMHYLPRLWGNFCYMPGTKTFDNQDTSSAAMRFMIRQRIAQLPLQRKVKMGVIALGKLAGKAGRKLSPRPAAA